VSEADEAVATAQAKTRLLRPIALRIRKATCAENGIGDAGHLSQVTKPNAGSELQNETGLTPFRFASENSGLASISHGSAEAVGFYVRLGSKWLVLGKGRKDATISVEIPRWRLRGSRRFGLHLGAGGRPRAEITAATEALTSLQHRIGLGERCLQR
jgi:hypothetical protein